MAARYTGSAIATERLQMSLLRWFSRKSDAEAAPSSSLRDSRPAADSRKSERNARRERLYAVVRQSMANAGVLSSSYRFKVLSLDGRGRQFLVMVDLVGSPGGSTADLGRIEVAMQQAAKTQFGIGVKAVYWREASGAADGARAPAPGAPAAQSRPAGAGAPQRAAAAAAAPAVAAPAASPETDADPLLAEEMAAFRQALASGTQRPAARAADGPAVKGPQSYTLLTGFEDTEIRGPLSTSQHGDLR